MLPEKLRAILTSNPALAFILSFAASLTISYFTGIGSFVGLCNVCADIPFTAYVIWYKHHHGIKGLGIQSYKIWRIPVCPRLIIRYEKDGKCWEA
jgi:hypothetical protein